MRRKPFAGRDGLRESNSNERRAAWVSTTNLFSAQRSLATSNKAVAPSKTPKLRNKLAAVAISHATFSFDPSGPSFAAKSILKAEDEKDMEEDEIALLDRQVLVFGESSGVTGLLLVIRHLPDLLIPFLRENDAIATLRLEARSIRIRVIKANKVCNDLVEDP